MNHITNKTNEYPITKRTLIQLINKIAKNVKTKSNTTFSFGSLVGGSRAWFKFILNKTNLIQTNPELKKHKIVVFDPTECYEPSTLAFFYLLLKQLKSGNKVPDYDKISLQKVVDLLQEYFDTNKSKVLIFALKLDNFDCLNPQTGNLLYTLWKDNKSDLSFVITLNRNWSNSEITQKFGAFSEAILQNYERIDKVDNSDIEQSVHHWMNKLEISPSQKELETLIKYSRGLPYLSKVLCQELSKGYEGSLDKLLASVTRQFISRMSNSKLVLKKNGGLIFFNNTDISRNFSYQEFSVLKLLIERSDNVVNRDELADVLWGKKAFEKYSEWAIDKFISLTRKKLEKLNFSGEIKVKKGEGFILLQPE